MCGFVGIFNSNSMAAPEVYEALMMIQHRGQDAAGILTYDGEKFHIKKGSGLAKDIFHENNMKLLQGNVGLGHTRYPTVGAGGVEDAQPFISHKPYGLGICHNGNIYNHYDLKKELFEQDKCLVNSDCDVEVILNILSISLLKQRIKGDLKPEHIFKAVKSVFKRAIGGYSVVVYIAGHGLLAFKDPNGIKPGVLGKRGSGMNTDYIVTSESVVIDVLGFEYVKDMQAGEAIFIDLNRKVHSKVIDQRPHTPCLFEYIYFARPDTTIDNISVHKARIRMGKKLGKVIKKANLDIDVVIPVPDSSRSAATGVSEALNVPLREGLIKNRYVGRTFIMPNQKMRQKSVRQKLNPIPYELRKKNVLLVDDSIVRGTTSKQIIEMVRKAGARKVYFASAAPEVRFPCLYGVDIPDKKGLIANKLNVDEIRTKIGADELFYPEIEDVIAATKSPKAPVKKFCSACFSGKYPTKGVTNETLEKNELNYGTLRGDDKSTEQLTIV